MAASTTVKVTNSTGYAASFAGSYNFDGHITDGAQYPSVIRNNETIEFVFVSEEGVVPAVSSGAVVYQGQNGKGKNFDWTYAWHNEKGENNGIYKTYTKIAKANSNQDWPNVKITLMNSGRTSHAENENCASDAQISQLQPATYEGTMSLKGEA